MAVQCCLLASSISKIQDSRFKILGTVSFLVTKLITYTVLGVLLGWMGSKVQLNLTGQAVLQMAGALLDAHPFFRHFVIQPPRFLTRWIRGQSKSGELFAPAILGAATVFIPCGTTQAMMALAVGTGNPVWGAAVMAAFVIGTRPA